MEDAHYLNWSEGRKLTGGSIGNTNFSYSYNADGLRTRKVVDGTVYHYYWMGSQLAAMQKICRSQMKHRKILIIIQPKKKMKPLRM